jgi:hypothetical protein
LTAVFGLPAAQPFMTIFFVLGMGYLNGCLAMLLT